MAKAEINNIDQYIDTFPEDVQKRLEKIRKIIKDTAPDVREEIKWSRPAFSDDERILVMFAAFKKHIGFYTTPSTLKAFAEPLSAFKTGRGSIQLPLDQPLPTSLIRRITEYRARESREKGVKWKS